MIKKLLITLALVLTLSFSASAFDTKVQGGVGWMTMEGRDAVAAYSFGFNIPIVQKQSAGFVLMNVTDYLQSDGWEGEGDVQVVRIYMLVEKNFVTAFIPTRPILPESILIK